MPDPRALPSAAARRLTGLLGAVRGTAAVPAADPVVAAYLNERLSATTALADRLRRAAGRDELAAEKPLLDRLRRHVGADRARLRAAMRTLGVGVDWSVLGVTWVSGQAGRVLPLLHRLPPLERVAEAVDRLPVSHPQRQGDVLAVLVLEEVLGDLARHHAAAATLGRWVAPEAAASARTEVLAGELAAAHAARAALLG